MSGRAHSSRSAGDLRRPLKDQRGPNGRRLCTWCREEVPKGRLYWCSDVCVDAYKIQSNPAYFRLAVWRRDRGICAVCRLDTDALDRDLDEIRRLERDCDRSWMAGTGLRRLYLALVGWPAGWRPTDHLWEADHIVPVSEGGDDSLANARTLCRPCHRRVTAEMRRRQADARRAQRPLFGSTTDTSGPVGPARREEGGGPGGPDT